MRDCCMAYMMRGGAPIATSHTVFLPKVLSVHRI